MTITKNISDIIHVFKELTAPLGRRDKRKHFINLGTELLAPDDTKTSETRQMALTQRKIALEEWYEPDVTGFMGK